MSQIIIYRTDEGGIALITPILDCGLSIEEIAAKDVPEGKSYKIINLEDVPADRAFRDAWEWQE